MSRRNRSYLGFCLLLVSCGCLAVETDLAAELVPLLESASTAAPVTPPESAPAAAPAEPPSANWIRSSGRWLELQRDSFSDTVMTSAKGIDAYLARENIDESLTNESYLKVQLRQRYVKSGSLEFEAQIKARLRLPNSKRRLKLTFDSDPDDFDSIANRRLDMTAGSRSPRDVHDTAIAGVGFEKYLGKNWDSSYNLGMKLRLPLDPYVRAHWKHSNTFVDQWRGRFVQRFSYFHTEGWKSESNQSFYRPLSDTLLFQSTSSVQYLDKEDSWEPFQSLSLHQTISTDTAFEHQIGVSAISRPSLRTSGYWIRTELRHRLYKDWLFIKVAPELFSGRDDNFDLTPSMLFEVEVYFGSAPR